MYLYLQVFVSKKPLVWFEASGFSCTIDAGPSLGLRLGSLLLPWLWRSYSFGLGGQVSSHAYLTLRCVVTTNNCSLSIWQVEAGGSRTQSQSGRKWIEPLEGAKEEVLSFRACIMETNEILRYYVRVKDRCVNIATQSPLRKDKVHPCHSTSSLFIKRRG